MKKRLFLLLIAALALVLAGCRFAVVESGSVRIEAPTPTPEATPRPEPTAATQYQDQMRHGQSRMALAGVDKDLNHSPCYWRGMGL